MMRERTRLDKAISDYRALEQQLEDNLELIELGEVEDDADVVAEAEVALAKLARQTEKQELQSLLSGEGRRQRLLRRDPCRGRRHRIPGLGGDAAAHVRPLERAARPQD